MNRETFALIENYMLSCMKDSAHDSEHIYRVLYNAIDIAATEEDVDYDILICACLLHDVGRQEQYDNPKLCHALVGGDKAYTFLTEHRFDAEYAEKVKQCIITHRFRENMLPASIEAKILFDADKLDVTGAIGIARTLLYQGNMCEPLYTVSADGKILDGTEDSEPSFFEEYKYKLEHIDTFLFTDRARKIAAERKKAAAAFYNSLYAEVSTSYQNGKAKLQGMFSDKTGENA